jgi:UDP-glucose:glycoprotein glucosyltransferase
MWLILDQTSERGVQLLFEILEFLSSRAYASNVKLNIVPIGQGSGNDRLALLHALQDLDVTDAYSIVSNYLVDGTVPLNESRPGIDIELPGHALNCLSLHLNLDVSLKVIVDGRVVDFPSSARLLDAESLGMLLDYEQTSRTKPILNGLIETLGIVPGDRDDVFQVVDSVVSLYSRTYFMDSSSGMPLMASTASRVYTTTWNDDASGISIGDVDAALQATVVLDPLSTEGQHLSAFLEPLSHLPIHIKVLLNPMEYGPEDQIPLKRFYKASLPDVPTFNELGEVALDTVKFEDLPQATLLWLGLKTPEAWIATPSASDYDLDNIILNRVSENSLEATYKLEFLLLEGYARDTTSGGVPHGVALDFRSLSSTPYTTDTIIMENLGYFQIKASPGLFKLSIESGRQRDVYALESTGQLGLNGLDSEFVYISDMRGATVAPQFSRRKGMEKANALESTSPTWLQKFFDLFNRFSSRPEPENAEINLFTVASGHLYERFLSIMTASVMNHTEHTVKFWLIENFLSPTFKEFLPYLADEYGFQYELVTYKWPHWLRGQSEKQREIWGYKILFLDALFPQSLDKVIFVDADQIVRTDMKDLVDLDLHGAPYGFTPMCDSRGEMEGFRFWKQGYWKRYLGDLKYHISALFVVDLKRFRELGIGDKLRQHYQTLSADPDSLSNLDQDLPNHLQKLVPIYSLPQDWLWCETWCSDEALKTAKTIDLCNNPLTKEPKLDRARRQIPEWVQYDNAISNLMDKFKSDPGISKDAAEIETEDAKVFDETTHDDL